MQGENKPKPYIILDRHRLRAKLQDDKIKRETSSVLPKETQEEVNNDKAEIEHENPNTSQVVMEIAIEKPIAIKAAEEFKSSVEFKQPDTNNNVAKSIVEESLTRNDEYDLITPINHNNLYKSSHNKSFLNEDDDYISDNNEENIPYYLTKEFATKYLDMYYGILNKFS